MHDLKDYYSIFEHSVIGMALISIDGIFNKVNARFCEMTKFSSNELQQLYFEDIMYHEDISKNDDFKKLKKGQINRFQCEKRLIRKDKHVIWVNIHGSLIKSNSESPLLFVQIEEWTEQKLIENTLKKSDTYYRQLIEYLPEPMLIYIDSKIVYMNKKAIDLANHLYQLGSLEDYVNKSIYEFIHQDDLQQVKAKVEEMLNTGKPMEPMDIKLQGYSNEVIDVNASSVPIIYEGKQAIQVVYRDITERKEIQKELLESKTKYKSLIENHIDAVFIINKLGMFTEVNAAATKVTGYSKEELMQLNVEKLIVDKYKNNVADAFWRTLNNQAVVFDMKLQQKQGKQKDVIVSTIPMEVNGEVIGLFGIVKDITDQRKAEKAAKEHYANTITILESITDAFLAIDKNWNISYMNEEAERISGKPKEIVVGENFWKSFPRLKNTNFEKNYRKAMVSLETVQFEEYFSTFARWYAIRIYPSKTGLSIYINDVTDKKRIEELVRESEERYRTIIQTANDSIIVTDEQMEILNWNDAAEETFGYTAEEAIGKNLSMIIPKKYRNGHSEGVRNFHSHGHTVVTGNTVELYGLRKDGTEFPLELSLTNWKANNHTYFCGIIRDITDRKNAENDLYESKERFFSIFNNAGIGIALVGLDGKILNVNKQLQETLQYTEDEFYQKSFTDITHPEDIEKDLSLFTDLINSDINRYQIEKRYYRKDHQIVWGRLTVSLVKNRDGNLLFAIGMVEDISDRKKVEKALKESNNQIKDILESITDAFFSVDQDWNFTYVNQEAEYLLDRSKDNLIGKNLWDVFVEAKDTTFYKEYNRAVSQNASVRFEEYYPPLQKWFSVSAYPGKNSLSVYFKDITNVKVSEENLRSSKEKLSKIIETAPSGILMLNKEGEITLANEAAEAILGLTKKDMEQRIYNAPDWKITAIDGSIFLEEDLPFVKVLRDNKPVFNVEHAVEKPNGERIILSVNVTPLRNVHGAINGVLATITDISKRIQSEQKLIEANKMLKKISSSDGLTGVSNRRHFNEVFEQEWKKAVLNSSPITVILFDIDHFKEYNDTYGHQSGDECLKQLASSMELLLSERGLFARYGGEEFVIILPNTDKEKAVSIAEEIRLAVLNLKIPHIKSSISSYVTISLGTATVIPSMFISTNDLIEHADKALYEAKRAGRNQVKVFT